MFLIAGLGNYGAEYKNTRHNVGFQVVDKICEVYKIYNHQKKFSADLYSGDILGEKVVLCKPLTYMNRSGIAIKDIKAFYKVLISNIIVIHDDLDLELGRIKVKVGGGAGGHNGLKSIDENIGKNYLRIRVGIGRPTHENEDVSSFVLKNFSADEKKVIDKRIDLIVKNLPLLMQDGHEKFLNEVGLELKK